MLGAIIIFSLFLTFLMHVFLVRICGAFKKAFFRQKGLIASYLIGFIPLGFLFCLWIGTINVKSWPGIFWSGIYLFFIYSIFSYVYFHFFNMSETARRIRILSEIHRTGSFKKDELIHKYPASDIVSNRLKRLIALRELRLFEDRYLIGKGLFILPAKMVFYFRGIIHPE